MNIETPAKYNKRVEKAIQAFLSQGSSVAIIGKGRSLEEQSLVLVEKGNYFGYGFFDNQVSIADLESARNYVRKSVETPTVQNLINSYITNPRGARVITFST
jgi:DNA polymerase-3 subunit epsilon